MQLLFCLLFVGIAFASPTNNLHTYQWNQFKQTYGKVYADTEELHRQKILESNLDIIHQHNLEADMGLHSYWLGVNEYADWSNEEFRSHMNGYKGNKRNSALKFVQVNKKQDLPDTVNWVQKGYVTEVKNQGQCGSCWAFSTTGSMEGAVFKKTQNLVSLSEQNLMDCSWKYGNNGCNGGLMDYAFNYIIDAGGDDTEPSYPYMAKSSHLCKFNSTAVGGIIKEFVDLPQEDEDALLEAVATVGPISIAIDAAHYSFQLYKSGVYDEPSCSSTRLDHGVLNVGYGVLNGKKYWLVKNSWGSTWGLDGYILMARDKNNQCGIATAASYPIA